MIVVPVAGLESEAAPGWGAQGRHGAEPSGGALPLTCLYEVTNLGWSPPQFWGFPFLRNMSASCKMLRT
jgi:hypothetical protein